MPRALRLLPGLTWRAGVSCMLAGALVFLTSCAAWKSTLLSRTIYNPGTPEERIEETELRSLSLKTVLVNVGADEQSSRFVLDRDGAFDMRTGGSVESFDGTTGPIRIIEIAGETAAQLAPFISQYLAAQRAMDMAAGEIARRVVVADDRATSRALETTR